MTILKLYYRSTELKSFQNIAGYDETIQSIPVGYQYYYTRYAPLYIDNTTIQIGYFIGNNSYQNIGGKMAYCNNNSTIFIEKILPIGAINYINIFKTTNPKPKIPNNPMLIIIIINS